MNAAQFLARLSASTSRIVVSANVTSAASVLVLPANSARKGLWIYNNSNNSAYIAFGSAANSATNMTAPIATFATLILPLPMYTGAIYAIRNGTGVGTIICTELT